MGAADPAAVERLDAAPACARAAPERSRRPGPMRGLALLESPFGRDPAWATHAPLPHFASMRVRSASASASWGATASSWSCNSPATSVATRSAVGDWVPLCKAEFRRPGLAVAPYPLQPCNRATPQGFGRGKQL